MTKPDHTWNLVFAAFAMALVASLAALFIGEVMGQVPCNLCWFQRVFMFPLAVVLGLAALRADENGAIYGLALAGPGWLIAGYHVLLYSGFIPQAIQPCEKGPSCSGANMTIFGSVPLPMLSFVAFTVIFILLSIARRRSLS